MYSVSHIFVKISHFQSVFNLFLVEIKNRFDSNASSTYKTVSDNPTFELEYDIGKISGARAKETVSVIKNLNFCLIDIS